ncbi:isoamyl acetate-hydrolyzing esterase [Mycoemilia scoparia]|uniref:Isoamyl acetate-hydrolyzing esterase n=1 Tax=Mycoemilia scoparia TaxID=417184 RepID=A0A9W7ZWP6_9FUNG|nr:isoamyl acetate-hydrolyzing esterase [Mycoemilia scoparia]
MVIYALRLVLFLLVLIAVTTALTTANNITDASIEKRSVINDGYKAATKDYIVVFGDSITEYGCRPTGFVTKLAEAYKDKLDVVPLPYGGRNAKGGRTEAHGSTMPEHNKDTNAPSPRLIIVEFGTNDSVSEGYYQHLPLFEYLQNMWAIHDDFADPNSPYYAPKAKIMFVTPGPLGLRMWNKARGFEPHDVPKERDNDQVLMYGNALKSLAEKIDVPGFDQFFEDGVHLNPEGNVVMFETIMRTIKKNMPELLPENL